MNLFTSLMPGLRQLRTPLAVGASWLVIGYLALWQNWQQWTASFTSVGLLAENIATVPLPYLVGGLAFVAYLIGAAMQGLSAQFGRLLTAATDWLERVVRNDEHQLTVGWRRYLHRRREKYSVRRTVMDSVSAAYSAAKFPSAAFLSFPFYAVEEQLEGMSLQLWHRAPDQYQESDRLRAESEFRVGMSLPLTIIGVQLAMITTWWVAAPFAVGAVVLILQARSLRSERRALLANALFQGLAVNSTLAATVQALGELKLPKKMDLHEWYAATAIAVDRAGHIDGNGAVVSEGALELSDAINFAATDWKVQVDSVADRVRRIFVDNGHDDNLEFFDRQIAIAQERTEVALKRIETSGIDEGDSVDWAGRRAWQGRV